MIIRGQIIDLAKRTFFKGEIHIAAGKIKSILPKEHNETNYIIPGFVDAHIHIESSMLVPSEFAKIAVIHGTVATVSDPHEIANVLGIAGVRYMIDNGKKVPFKFNFGAPSCVPATSFESAGSVIDSEGIKTLLADDDICYLAEMMNYPGVLFQDAEVMRKIAIAKSLNKPIDGHAPGLRGADLSTYINAGITTDHESYSYEEGKEKLEKGMKILIREGSAAKNFDALAPLIPANYKNMMFCSDDKHPDDLIIGHINQLVKRAKDLGYNIFDLIEMACINPVKHYKLAVGLLTIGDSADFIVVNNLDDLNVLETYIAGKCVAKNGKSFIKDIPFDSPNNFNCSVKTVADFALTAHAKKINVIEALDGELITNPLIAHAKIEGGNYVSDVANDILKIVVVNRYKNTKPAVAFIKNFGLKRGAIASSVAHDSHNIIAVGADDASICTAVNSLIHAKGGIVACDSGKSKILPLPVAGIMSNLNGFEVGKRYQEIDAFAKSLGSTLNAPYMTLSFMALLVIPALKLSDFGLFNGYKFEFTPVEHSE